MIWFRCVESISNFRCSLHQYFDIPWNSQRSTENDHFFLLVTPDSRSNVLQRARVELLLLQNICSDVLKMLIPNCWVFKYLLRSTEIGLHRILVALNRSYGSNEPVPVANCYFSTVFVSMHWKVLFSNCYCSQEFAAMRWRVLASNCCCSQVSIRGVVLHSACIGFYCSQVFVQMCCESARIEFYCSEVFVEIYWTLLCSHREVLFRSFRGDVLWSARIESYCSSVFVSTYGWSGEKCSYRTCIFSQY